MVDTQPSVGNVPARHRLDHGGKVVARQRDTGEPDFGHQQVEGRYHDRFLVDRDHDEVPVDPRAVQPGANRGGNARGIDRGVRSVSAGQVADGRYDVGLAGIEHHRRAERAHHLRGAAATDR